MAVEYGSVKKYAYKTAGIVVGCGDGYIFNGKILYNTVIAELTEEASVNGGYGYVNIPYCKALTVEGTCVAPVVVADGYPVFVPEVDIGCELSVYIGIACVYKVLEPLKLIGCAYLIVAVYKLRRLCVAYDREAVFIVVVILSPDIVTLLRASVRLPFLMSSRETSEMPVVVPATPALAEPTR